MNELDRIQVGDIVHSNDDRDDSALYYVVRETDVRTTSGMCAVIAPADRPDDRRYRLEWLLVSARDEIQREVAATNDEAARIRAES